jgi:hypothetical protein
MGKVTKKRSSKFFGREFLEVGLRPKKGRQIFLAAPPFQISKYATVVLPVLNLGHSVSSAAGNHPVILWRRRCSFCSMYARLLEPMHRRRRHLTVHTSSPVISPSSTLTVSTCSVLSRRVRRIRRRCRPCVATCRCKY